MNVTPRLLLSVKDEDARELVNGLAHAGVTCAKYYGATQKRESGRKDKSRLVAILPRPPPNHASVGNRHNLSRPSRRTLLRLQKTVRQREERGEEERQGGMGGVADEECGGGRGRMSAVTEPKSKKEDRKATAGVSIIGRTQSGTTWREIAAYIRGELRGFLVPASRSEKPHREPRAGLPTSRQYQRPRLHTHTQTPPNYVARNGQIPSQETRSCTSSAAARAIAQPPPGYYSLWDRSGWRTVERGNMALPCSISLSKSRVLAGIQSWRCDGMRLVLDLFRGGCQLYRLERRRRIVHVCVKVTRCDGGGRGDASACSDVAGGNECDAAGWPGQQGSSCESGGWCDTSSDERTGSCCC